jgi:integrase
MGLRVTEAVHLKQKHFRDLAQGFVWVPTAKKRNKIKLPAKEVEKRKKAGVKHPGWTLERFAIGDRPEMRISVAPDVIKEMGRYLKTFNRNPEAWVFKSQQGNNPLTERQAFAIFSKACKGAKLGHKSFHALRHYRGFLVQSSLKDIDWTRRQLRHESIETTKIYTSRTSEEEKRLAEKASW